MLLLDVNVLVYAFRPEQSSAALEVRRWLDAAMEQGQVVAASTEVLAAQIRIVTDRRIFERPAGAKEALAFTQAFVDAPMSRIVVPSSRHWAVFSELVEDLRLTGNDVPDAYLAALAIDHSARLVTRDRGFRRFPGLRLLDPLAA